MTPYNLARRQERWENPEMTQKTLDQTTDSELEKRKLRMIRSPTWVFQNAHTKNEWRCGCKVV